MEPETRKSERISDVNEGIFDFVLEIAEIIECENDSPI
jgi:hypothetical protein